MATTLIRAQAHQAADADSGVVHDPHLFLRDRRFRLLPLRFHVCLSAGAFIVSTCRDRIVLVFCVSMFVYCDEYFTVVLCCCRFRLYCADSVCRSNPNPNLDASNPLVANSTACIGEDGNPIYPDYNPALQVFARMAICISIGV